MKRLSQIEVGVPTFSAIFVVAAATWYCAVILGLREGKGFLSGVSDFWAMAYFACPLLCVLLAPIFTRLYVAGNRPYPWMFWPALVLGLSPALWFGVLIILS